MKNRSLVGFLPSLLFFALSGCGLLDAGGSGEQGLTTDDPPAACADLDEASCLARSDCEATYVEWGCACPACAPGTDCPPCECDPAPAREFAGCIDRDPCAGLDEQTCVDTDGCTPIYGVGPCPLAPCIENPDGTFDCPPCDDTKYYQGCSSEPINTDPCSGLSEKQCLSTEGCAPLYGGRGNDVAPPSDPSDPTDPSSPVPAPDEYLGCYSVPPPSTCADLPQDVCIATPGCEPEYIEPCILVCDDTGLCQMCGPDNACHPIGEECGCEPIFAGCHEAGCGTPVPVEGR